MIKEFFFVPVIERKKFSGSKGLTVFPILQMVKKVSSKLRKVEIPSLLLKIYLIVKFNPNWWSRIGLSWNSSIRKPIGILLASDDRIQVKTPIGLWTPGFRPNSTWIWPDQDQICLIQRSARSDPMIGSFDLGLNDEVVWNQRYGTYQC